MPLASIIDPKAIENIRSLDPENPDVFLRELTAAFLADMQERLAELDSSLAHSDAATFIRSAHTIKGMAGNFGATQLYSSALTLESAARNQGLGNLNYLINTVKAESVLVRQELQQFVA